MAVLETISFTPWREEIGSREVVWTSDRLSRQVSELPQIYWKGGEPWSEVNHWALARSLATAGGNIKTVTTQMKHLFAYATWLELAEADWRHFPVRDDERATVRFRGELVRQRDEGMLAPSTAKARMAAVIQFYRFANIHGFVSADSPLWQDRQVVHRFHNTAGFARAIMRISSELRIPNRQRIGLTLEDGLRPLSQEHAAQLLESTKGSGPLEVHYMLSLGLLSGARLGTITTLGVRNLELAMPDDSMEGFSRIRVGPGTGVDTKFDVSGELLVPTFLVDELKAYAYSMRRLRRQARASDADRGRLFLTRNGNPYLHQSFNRLMTELRRRSVAGGLRFMKSFRFHQTRATFGTMLTELALQVANVPAVVAFVRGAMLHKDEATTLRYIKFVQEAPVRARISENFAAVFTGVVKRDWSQFNA